MSTVNFNDTTPAAPTGTVNLKFQSDASGNISAYNPGGTWQTWTPSVTGGGSMTVSPTIDLAEYLRNGPFCTVRFLVHITAGGTANSVVILSLPFPSVTATNLYVPVSGWNTTGTNRTIPLVANIQSTLQIFAGGDDITNYQLGAALFLSGHFSYRCA